MNVLTDCKKISKKAATLTAPLLLLHFHAPACRVSRSLALVLSELRNSYKGELEFRQINVEEYPTNQLLVDYEVFSLPTLLLLDGEIPLVRIQGFISRQKLEEILNRFLRVSYYEFQEAT
ncbi:MAG TPA: thioredoxin family protein [Candidatus Limnocylindrales bacterium]|nr:thioredoxin family protein [Candidatus Limnocylindrales bacterium]